MRLSVSRKRVERTALLLELGFFWIFLDFFGFFFFFFFFCFCFCFVSLTFCLLAFFLSSISALSFCWLFPSVLDVVTLRFVSSSFFFFFFFTGSSNSALTNDLVSHPLVVLYYLVLAIFILVVAVLVLYYTLRLGYELSVINSGENFGKGTDWSCCCVRGLRAILFVAFFLLVGLFASFWIFWGQVRERRMGTRVLH